MSYLSEAQIRKMADRAFTAYEMACTWSAAFDAAQELALEEFGIRPRRSAVMLAVKHAKVRWMAESARVRRAIEESS